MKTLAILGAGKVGTVLARLAVAAGYKVFIAGSGPADKIELIIDVLAPGARAVTSAEAIEGSDMVVLAIPLHGVTDLPAKLLRGKLVIDAINYWEPVDGTLPEYTKDGRGTSEIVASHLPETRFVKAFSHLGYHDLEELAGRPAPRVALALAGNHEADVKLVAALIDDLGFDPLPVGPLVVGRAFQAHTPAFGVALNKDELAAAIASVIPGGSSYLYAGTPPPG